MHALINFVAFQVGWFSSVIGAAREMPWVGPLVVLVVAAIHLGQARQPRLELGLIVACGIIGLCFDSMLVALGWVAYPSGYFASSLAPYWIVTLWMLFATTLNQSMGWLKGRLSLSAFLGAVAGPMSYIAGQKLGGMEFVAPAYALAFLAAGWAVVMPIVVTLAERLNGFKLSPALEGDWR